MNMMKRKLLLIGVSVSMLIGAVSVAASSGVELHEFFNEASGNCKSGAP